MSLQKAIEKEEDIWEAFDRVRKEHGMDKPWQPSEDTQYKKDLTAWIERKNQEKNPYSIFEAWQEVCPRTCEEGEG